MVLSTLRLLCLVFGFASSVIGDEILQCGIMNEKTVGTHHDAPDLPGAAHIEIEDHRSFSRRSYHRSSRDKSVASPQDRERRVVNGTRAETLENFPWNADLSLRLRLYRNAIHPYNIHLCSGAIISEYYILTVASCLERTSEMANHKNWTLSLRLSVGEFDQSKDDPMEEHFEVESAILHEDYELLDTTVNDIALIKVKAKDGHGILFNDHIKPVCLPSPHTPYTEGNLLTVGGWGLTYTEHDISESYSRYLYTAEIRILSISSCAFYCRLIRGSNERYHCLKDGQLCLGYPEGGIDTCAGDAGVPAVQNINGRFTLMALTSFGVIKCGRPALYTNVQYFLPWIKSAMVILG